MTIDEEIARCEVTGKRPLGGQHTNGPDYSVRLVHPDFGIEVTVEHSRKRVENRELAEIAMRTLLVYIKNTSDVSPSPNKV